MQKTAVLGIASRALDMEASTQLLSYGPRLKKQFESIWIWWWMLIDYLTGSRTTDKTSLWSYLGGILQVYTNWKKKNNLNAVDISRWAGAQERMKN